MTNQHITASFEQQVDRVGDRIAVRTVSHAATYRELDAHANGVALRLKEVGAGPDTRVALLTDQEPRGCAALVGILKSGATCVPISRTEPTSRVLDMVRDSGSLAVVAHAPYLDHFSSAASSGLTILDLDDVGPTDTREFPLPGAEHLTFILYTSGSTGRPKGVLQTNRGSHFKVSTWQETLGLTTQDRLSLFATFATGHGSTTTLLGLLSGATLCPFDVRNDGVAQCSQWLHDFRITVYCSSSTLFRSLAGGLDGPPDCPDLRVIRIGGERVTPQDVDLARTRFPGADLVHGYSATETGNIATYTVPKDVQFSANDIIPVGPPRQGLDVRILSPDGHQLPPGSVGQIVVGGEHLSPGYWNDPERTAEAFGPLEYAPTTPAWRTGDLGRVRSDGFLEHHGRQDFRVKIRGFRIELEEVEAAIETHSEICRVAAAAVPQSNGVDLTLAAYVQVADEASLTPEMVRTYLGQRLPDHMVPSLFMFLDALPLTPSGKVDRRALPHLRSDGPTRSVERVPPRSPLEVSIAELWKSVLQVDQIGIHDHFLEVGGDSLRATQIATRLWDELQVKITMRDLFEAATVAEIASIVERTKARGTGVDSSD